MENVLKVNGDVTLTSNYEEVKLQLKNNIDSKYSIVVTNENVKDSKAMMAQINKEKNQCKDNWLAIKKDLEAPIKELDAKVKDLLSLYDDARGVISNQVNIFEEGTRRLANELAIKYCETLLDIKKLDKPDVYPVWSNLTFITESNKLSSAGKKAVEDFVNKLELDALRLKEIELQKQMEREKIKQEAIKEYQLDMEVKKEILKETNPEIKQDVIPDKVEPVIVNTTCEKLVTITLKFISKNDNETIKNNVLNELSDKFKKCVNSIEVKDI